MLTLHAHSYYTLLNSTIPVKQLVDTAKAYGSKYVALTDLNGMHGLLTFYQYAKEQRIKPILGVQLDDPNDSELQVVLLARNNDGYKRICELITERKLNDKFFLPNIFQQDLTSLFVITSSIKLLQQIEITLMLRQHFFIELIITDRHKVKSRELYNFAKENHLRTVATHPAYFQRPEDYEVHKTLTAIKLIQNVDAVDQSELIDHEYYLKSPEEIRELWAKLPESLWNAEEIAKKCDVELDFKSKKMPIYPTNGEDAYSILYKLCFQGLVERYEVITEILTKRLQYEMEVIQDMGFTNYFLVVWDIVREGRRRKLMNIGRGSAGNSLVAYCLYLSHVDPIANNFHFERFMNPGRTTPPDIDIDFSWRERDEIIKYIYDKYGFDKVAMISSHVTFKLRSAFRLVAKAHGIENDIINDVTRKLPFGSAKNLRDIHKYYPETRNLRLDGEYWKPIVDVADKISDFPRHLSIHAAGIVISPEKITNYLAVEYADNKGIGLTVTQPDMYPIEEFGLVKIDILSQRSLGVLRDTVETIINNKHIQ